MFTIGLGYATQISCEIRVFRLLPIFLRLLRPFDGSEHLSHDPAAPLRFLIYRRPGSRSIAGRCANIRDLLLLQLTNNIDSYKS